MKHSKALTKTIRRSKMTNLVTRHENRERRRSRIYQIRNPISTNESGNTIIVKTKTDSSHS